MKIFTTNHWWSDLVSLFYYSSQGVQIKPVTFLIPELFCHHLFVAFLVLSTVNVVCLSECLSMRQAQNATLLFTLKCRFNNYFFRETCHGLVYAMLTSKRNQFAKEKWRRACFNTVFSSSSDHRYSHKKCIFCPIYNHYYYNTFLPTMSLEFS